MFLLDTNVVSELRRAKPHGGVLAWLRATTDAALRISALTLGEIQRGVEKLRGVDPEKAAEIERWADRIEETFAVLPADARIFRRQARLLRAQPEIRYEDALIAATARVHGLTVATRNVRDFATFEVTLVNTFAFRGA